MREAAVGTLIVATIAAGTNAVALVLKAALGAFRAGVNAAALALKTKLGMAELWREVAPFAYRPTAYVSCLGKAAT